MENPFFNKRYDTPHEVPPFDKIQFEHYEPAMMEGMRQETEAIEALCNNPEEPTFENTIMPKTGEMLENVTSVFFNLLSACNSPEMEELSQKMAPLLSEHSNRITMNERLFQRIKHVWEKRHELDTEQQILMEKIYDGFLRTGANLPKDKKEELAELRKKLSQLSLQFSQNELHETNAWTMHLTAEEDLEGLPESAVAAARQEAETRGLEGWVITLQAPSYGPFMQYSQRRDLREKVYRAMNSICTHENENNNFENVRQLVNLRQQLAQIMGHKTYADFVLERRMAKDVEHVTDLMDKLLEAYRPVAEKEVEEIEQLARDKEGEDFVLQPWDFSHYGYLLKMQRYNIDSEMLAVDKTMHHEDVTCPEVVTLLLRLDPVDRAALECERNGLAVEESEHLRLVKEGHIHTTTVRAVIMDDLIVCLCDLRFHHKVFKHKTVLYLGNSKQSMPCTVFLLHGLDHLSHVLKFLLVLCLSPLVLSFREELLVILCRIVVCVEEILKVVESDHIVLRTLFLCISSGAEKRQSRQYNKYSFHI